MAEDLPRFVRRRRPAWEELAQLVERVGRDRLGLDELARLDRLYRRATSDLALARAFYPGSDAYVFLNQLCARAYGAIYRRRPSKARALKRFVLNDFPGTFVAEIRFFWMALGLLLAGALTGVVAALAEPASVEAVVPAELRAYINQGTLWTDTVLVSATPLVLGSQILVNNMAVALTAFGMGLTAGLGTGVVLLFNGLHIGAILTLCFRADLGFRLLGFMVAHGFVEIAAILIAGQAGLILGAAIIAPGELSRADALRLRGRRALRLVLGTLPLFFAIGMVEGFVSPGQLFAGWLKLALGVTLVALLFAYLIKLGRAAAVEDDA